MKEKSLFTQKEYESFFKKKLSSDISWTRHALKIVYFNQTHDEKRGRTSLGHDDKGFTRFDGNILTSIAILVINKAKLNEHQTKVLFEKMPKYWKQALKVADLEKLHKAMNDGRQLNIFKDK